MDATFKMYILIIISIFSVSVWKSYLTEKSMILSSTNILLTNNRQKHFKKNLDKFPIIKNIEHTQCFEKNLLCVFKNINHKKS